MWLPCFGIVAGLAILVLLCASLPYMSICTGIIVSISFEKIDNSPHAYTCSDCSYYCFKSCY